MPEANNKNRKHRKARQVFTPIAHDSAVRHVSGTANYVDDLPEPRNLLHCYIGTSEVAHASILNMDLSAVEAYPGVVRVMTHSDIPGSNDISPVHLNDEPLLAHDLIEFAGQPLFAVAAESRAIARQAARLVKIEVESGDAQQSHQVVAGDPQIAGHPAPSSRVTRPSGIRLNSVPSAKATITVARSCRASVSGVADR